MRSLVHCSVALVLGSLAPALMPATLAGELPSAASPAAADAYYDDYLQALDQKLAGATATREQTLSRLVGQLTMMCEDAATAARTPSIPDTAVSQLDATLGNTLSSSMDAISRRHAAGLLERTTPVCARVLGTAPSPRPAAVVEGHPITMDDIDTSGGRHLYDLAQSLYEERVQLLYATMGERLMALEAERLGESVETLRDREIAEAVPSVPEADLEKLFEEAPDLDRYSPRNIQQARLYLGVRARHQRKKAYIGELVARYDVEVLLAAPSPPPAEMIDGDFAPLVGRDDAVIDIVSFSDYQCRFCRDYEVTLAKVAAQYPDTVRITNRHFPAREDGYKLAEAALCAQEQDRFLDFHNALFARTHITSAQVMDVAASIGLDTDPFTVCLISGRHAERVNADVAEGQRLGIAGTPTSFINGWRIAGAVGLPVLVAKIEEELARLSTSASAQDADADTATTVAARTAQTRVARSQTPSPTATTVPN